MIAGAEGRETVRPQGRLRLPSWRRILPRLVRASALGLGISGSAEVKLELRTPASETYVIGDAIPVVWRFRNESRQALGFMWEGCCRLNGRLDVRLAGRAMATVPPGQALAHQFARGARLEPGVPRDYETQLQDWIVLHDTGTYELRGTYRGVLPIQTPQLPQGLPLWTESARSGPIEVKVLSVDDYLSQRGAREQRRGLRATLQGPTELQPLKPATFRVTIENLDTGVQALAWPEIASLWCLNSQHERVATATASIGADEAAPLILPPNGTAVRSFQVAPDRFEGEPLGDYEVFVDFASLGAHVPRVPSTVLRMSRRISSAQLVELLNAAAGGANAGGRNAPLKFLRVYLSDVGGMLAAVPASALSPEAQALAGRLGQASRLKVLAPRPGAVDLGLRVPPMDAPQWSAEVVRAEFGGGDPEVGAQLAALLGVRRHLGWEVSVVLEPSPETTISRLVALGATLEGGGNELAQPPAVVLLPQHTNAPAAKLVVLAGRAVRAPVLRLSTRGRSWSEDGVSFVNFPEETNVGLFAASLRPGQPLRVEADEDLAWKAVVEAVTPLVQPGARFELAILSPSGK